LEYQVLSQNRLTGTIPAALGNLSNLEYLSLYQNSLTGTLPNIFNEMNKISTILLSKNLLSGPFPFREISTKLQLKALLLGNNKFVGNIDSENITLMPSLTTIDISFNEFTGVFPNQLILKAPKLNSFIGGYNCFHGVISEDICNVTSMTKFNAPGLTSGESCRIPIWKGSASLQKTFPTFTVQYMDGTLPECLFGMNNMKELIVSGNGLLAGYPRQIR
jgi:LRR receptor-like serine/threonine-protein kinase FLS2